MIKAVTRFRSAAVSREWNEAFMVPPHLKRVPKDILRITPHENPPLFQIKDGWQSVFPYKKLTYSVISSTPKKKPVTVLSYIQSSFIGRNMEFYSKQIMEESLWILRPICSPGETPKHNRKHKLKQKEQLRNLDLAKYQILKGPQLFDMHLQANDILANYACIHEMTIPACKSFEIIHQNKDMLAVNKPAGVPVHPSGTAYRYNSLQYLLARYLNPEREITLDSTKLFPCHRLDKGTSGVLIFAKSQQSCSQLNKLLENRTGLSKTYLALVHGDFGGETKVSNDMVLGVDVAKIYEKGGVAKAEAAKSEFRRIHYDPKTETSLLLCKLHTGRRHQIRQHLRNMGFPIVNDPLYGVNGILRDPMLALPSRKDFQRFRTQYELQLQQRVDKWSMHSVCSNCYHVTYTDPETVEVMCLHAFEYTYHPQDPTKPGWTLRSSIPPWARKLMPGKLAARLARGSNPSI